MGFSEGIKGLGMNLQDGVKSASKSFSHITLRIITGVLVSLTLGLIGQELMGFGTFGLLFFMTVMSGVIFKTMSSWNLPQILIFDLICVLVAMLFRMYILVAP